MEEEILEVNKTPFWSFKNATPTQIIMLFVSVLALFVAVIWTAYRMTPEEILNNRILICTECGHKFVKEVNTLKLHDYKCPKCGGDVGEAFKCRKCFYEFPVENQNIYNAGNLSESELIKKKVLWRKCPNCGSTETSKIPMTAKTLSKIPR